MIIKEALLDNEISNIKAFLSTFSLKLDDNIISTLYIEDKEKIIGTISYGDNIIKDLAVLPDYQSEKLASLLVNEVINRFISKKIYNYQVFTKPSYTNVFTNLGFNEITRTDKLVMLEGGAIGIHDVIETMKKQIELRFAPIDENSDIACVVINGNPITTGHIFLIEKAVLKHKMVVVFVVEEDNSIFSFNERYSMLYLAVKRFPNVILLASSKYIVSSMTFPSYFLKNNDEVIEEMALIDALIFRDYFYKMLFFKVRYVGSEEKPKMIEYNNVLKSVLNDQLEIIPRIKENNQIVSASFVRSLLEQKNLSDASIYIPRECLTIFQNIARIKYGIK